MRVRCCDSDLEANLKESIKLGINAEKLGDAAKVNELINLKSNR